MGRLSLRPTPGTAMAVSTEDTVSDMPLSLPASTELLPLDTVCASVMLTPMPTMAMEAFMALDMEAMAMVDSTAMARGPLMLRPSQRLMRVVDTALALAMAMERGPLMLMPTTVTEAFMALAMEVMAMVDSTDMARGPLMLRPSQRLTPGTDTVAFTATVLALAMEGMAMVDSTDMERGPLMLTPSHG